MGWEHFQTVAPVKKEPQVRRGLFGVRLLILHFKFQFSKSIKSSTFHIFLNLTYPLRKNIRFPNCQKITQKFTQNHKTLVNLLSGGIWRCLKHERDIGTKAYKGHVERHGGWSRDGGEFYSNEFLYFFSLLYKHVKMLLELVSIIMDCIWPGKLDVDAEKAP